MNFGETRLIILKNDLSLCVRGLCVNECHTRVTLWGASPLFTFVVLGSEFRPPGLRGKLLTSCALSLT